jgi:hypothetical protein
MAEDVRATALSQATARMSRAGHRCWAHVLREEILHLLLLLAAGKAGQVAALRLAHGLAACCRGQVVEQTVR